MPIILSGTANVANLQSPDAYIQLLNPPTYIVGVPTDIGAVIGTASWGPLNTPILLGSPTEAAQAFGRISSAAVSGGPSGGADMKDLVTDLTLAFSQAQLSTLQMYGVRVSDGSDVKATITLLDSAGTPATGATATALYSGTEGNNITISFQPGSKTNTITTSIVGFPGKDQEIYPNLPSSGAGVFWAALASAVNSGMSGIRGPSQLVKLSGVSGSAIAPPTTGANASRALASGADGRTTATASTLLGSDTSVPKTGLYALRNISPKPSIAWCAGLMDNLQATALALAAFGDSEGIAVMYSNPAGSNTAAVLTNKQAWSQDTPNFLPVCNHVYYFDSVNNVVRLLPPYAVIGGRIATLSAEQSPLNKQVFGVIGTERNDPVQGTTPYSATEIGQLNQAGVMFVTNPIPAGSVFGIRTGVNSSSDPVKSPVEYARMTNFLASSYGTFMGKFVGLLQSTSKNDPVRNAVLTLFNNFHADLAANGKIDSHQTVCDLTNNTPSSIAKHFLIASVKVKYLSSVWYFIAQLQGGTTVVTQGSSPGQALA